MSIQAGATRQRRIWSAVACCLLWWTAGCSTLLSVAGLSVSASPGDPTREAAPGGLLAAPTPAAISAYQVAPALDWWQRLQPTPSSLARELFRESAFEGRCQPVPLGLRDVLDVPNGVTAAPLGRLGPFEAGVRGMPFSPLTLPDNLVSLTEGGSVDGGAPLADRGFACALHPSLYVRITGSTTEPVAVNR